MIYLVITIAAIAAMVAIGWLERRDHRDAIRHRFGE